MLRVGVRGCLQGAAWSGLAGVFSALFWLFPRTRGLRGRTGMVRGRALGGLGSFALGRGLGLGPRSSRGRRILGAGRQEVEVGMAGEGRMGCWRRRRRDTRGKRGYDGEGGGYDGRRGGMAEVWAGTGRAHANLPALACACLSTAQLDGRRWSWRRASPPLCLRHLPPEGGEKKIGAGGRRRGARSQRGGENWGVGGGGSCVGRC